LDSKTHTQWEAHLLQAGNRGESEDFQRLINEGSYDVDEGGGNICRERERKKERERKREGGKREKERERERTNVRIETKGKRE
jgi:hypothetical protein